jgi:hypothetical protein
MGILGVAVGRSLYLGVLCDSLVSHGLAIMIYVVGGMSRGQRGLMVTLVRVAAGGVVGVGLHVGGSVVGLPDTQTGRRLYTLGALEKE